MVSKNGRDGKDGTGDIRVGFAVSPLVVSWFLESCDGSVQHPPPALAGDEEQKSRLGDYRSGSFGELGALGRPDVLGAVVLSSDAVPVFFFVYG